MERWRSRLAGRLLAAIPNCPYPRYAEFRLSALLCSRPHSPAADKAYVYELTFSWEVTA